MQAIEYLIGVFTRKMFGSLDAIQVTPGPFSIFRKEVFEKIGNYRKAHNTEDFEITLRMHKAHLRIANSHKALVYTVGPATAKGFFYQRLRWARGFLENASNTENFSSKRNMATLACLRFQWHLCSCSMDCMHRSLRFIQEHEHGHRR
jgi:cellulose synthase/poly-beta-1,6-N-acetylglucosamine synthase-like glycosyltransferase